MSRSNESRHRVRTSQTRVRTLLFGTKRSDARRLLALAVLSAVVIALSIKLTRVSYTPTGPTDGDPIALYSTSYDALIDAFVATARGTAPSPLFVGAPIGLWCLAVYCGYTRRGVVPTIALVAGPIFGLCITRVGTPMLVATPNTPGLGVGSTPLREALLFAVAAIGLCGVPVAVLGFGFGAGCRRAMAS